MPHILIALCMLLTVVGAPDGATAAPLRIVFTYQTDLLDRTAGAAVGLVLGDLITGGATVDSALLDPSGDGVVPTDTFRLRFGSLVFHAPDDIFGAPEIEFLGGLPAAVNFATDFHVGPDAFSLELGLALTGDPEFRLTSIAGVVGAGPLVSIAVPGPATLVSVGAGLLLLVAVAVRGEPKASRADESEK